MQELWATSEPSYSMIPLDISMAKPQMDRILDDYKEPQASDVCPAKGPLKAFAFESNGPRMSFAIRNRF